MEEKLKYIHTSNIKLVEKDKLIISAYIEVKNTTTTEVAYFVYQKKDVWKLKEVTSLNSYYVDWKVKELEVMAKKILKKERLRILLLEEG